MPIDLDHYLPLKIGNLAERIAAASRDLYADHSQSNGQIRMLLAIDIQQDSSPVEIARLVHIDKALVSRTLKALEEQALIRTTRHGRGARIALSDEGAALAARLRPLALSLQMRMLDGFSATEAANLFTLLDRVRSNLDADPPLTGGAPQP